MQPDGILLAADYRHGLVRIDPATGATSAVLQTVISESFKGLNDLTLHDDESILFTDQGQTGLQDPTGRVWRLHKDGRLDKLIATGPSPNGLVLNTAQTHLYVAMTRSCEVWRFLLAPRRRGRQGAVLRTRPRRASSAPTGWRWTRADRLYIANPGHGCVWVIDPHGVPLYRIQSTAGRMTTNCALTPDERSLVITESETGSNPDRGGSPTMTQSGMTQPVITQSGITGEFVSICEVGPRDGLQIAKTRMTTDDKVRWIASIAAAGVQEIEVGSFVPPRVIPQLADTPEIVAQVLAALPGLTVQALAPNLRGVQNAYNAGVHKISIPVSVSEGHSRANLNRTPAQSIEMMREVMDWLKAQPRKVPVVAGASTAFGCSIDGVVTTAQTVAMCKGLADAGVDQIMLADTVGYAHPAQIKEVVRATREAIGPVLYGLHLHDTCGLGIANALAGLEEGIRAFDSCLAGLGGCPYAPGASGNVVTEDLVFMLESMGFTTGIDLPRSCSKRARCCTTACRRSRCTARCRRPAFRRRFAKRPERRRTVTA